MTVVPVTHADDRSSNRVYMNCLVLCRLAPCLCAAKHMPAVHPYEQQDTCGHWATTRSPMAQLVGERASQTPGAALDAAAGGRHEGLHGRRVRGASELLRLRFLALQVSHSGIWNPEPIYALHSCDAAPSLRGAGGRPSSSFDNHVAL